MIKEVKKKLKTLCCDFNVISDLNGEKIVGKSAEARLVCSDSFGADFILFDSYLKLTMVSALTETSDINDKCFKVYTDVNN